MTRVPTLRELYGDMGRGIHWLLAGACWCRKRHGAGEAGIVLAAPPWARQDETAGAA